MDGISAIPTHLLRLAPILCEQTISDTCVSQLDAPCAYGVASSVAHGMCHGDMFLGYIRSLL